MKIILDAMGSDNAPLPEVLGAVRAASEGVCEVLLIGRTEEILRVMNENRIATLPAGVEITNADDVVTMHDDPATVTRVKKESSLVAGLALLAEGGGDAFVSAGSTGALLSAATLVVKRIRGIRRGAIATIIPNAAGRMIVLDSGANAECTPEFLLQFGFMGSYYAESVMGIERPRVALLNNGAEESKGTPLQKESHALLRAAGEAGGLNFIGNIEGREALLGSADVIVADGFSGNVFLKTVEGAALFFSGMIKNIFYSNLKSKLAGALVKNDFAAMRAMMDYREVGGAPILGMTKPVVKAHGASDARAIFSALRQAAAFADKKLGEKIASNVELMKK